MPLKMCGKFNMIGFILNLPYTLIGLIVGFISSPEAIDMKKNPYAIVLKVRKLWWAIGYMKGARAVTIGHTILLGSRIENKDLEHELIHVQQYERAPLIYPILYYTELIRKGYKNNKYEVEAYRIAGNVYKEK